MSTDRGSSLLKLNDSEKSRSILPGQESHTESRDGTAGFYKEKTMMEKAKENKGKIGLAALIVTILVVILVVSLGKGGGDKPGPKPPVPPVPPVPPGPVPPNAGVNPYFVKNGTLSYTRATCSG